MMFFYRWPDVKGGQQRKNECLQERNKQLQQVHDHDKKYRQHTAAGCTTDTAPIVAENKYHTNQTKNNYVPCGDVGK